MAAQTNAESQSTNEKHPKNWRSVQGIGTHKT
jgi:hypothetical protein